MADPEWWKQLEDEIYLDGIAAYRAKLQKLHALRLARNRRRKARKSMKSNKSS